MIGTEFLKGQGLGNQLFCYVATRCMAADFGYSFGTANQDQFANNPHSNKGSYFMDVDLGESIKDTGTFNKYYEQECRIILHYSKHDQTLGCYVSGADSNLMNNIEDNTLIYGNLQDERYFIRHKSEIKEWLRIRDEFNIRDFSDDNICVLNMRGGEYVRNSELFLKKSYWEKAMKHMLEINSKMRFVIITEDVKTANMLFPHIKAYHLGMGEDYAAIHHAKYLIISNSSFAFFPVFTSDDAIKVIAPKYWARHNVSNGFWASEQNIYTGWDYMDRSGKLFSASECRQELSDYIRNNRLCDDYSRLKRYRYNIQNKVYSYFCGVRNRVCKIES